MSIVKTRSFCKITWATLSGWVVRTSHGIRQTDDSLNVTSEWINILYWSIIFQCSHAIATMLRAKHCFGQKLCAKINSHSQSLRLLPVKAFVFQLQLEVKSAFFMDNNNTYSLCVLWCSFNSPSLECASFTIFNLNILILQIPFSVQVDDFFSWE